ncbi:50S ribosomal protein L11 [Candidatus Woesearchaeota archaeon]|nr:50S ribosomal protein L11 [Candidatus Woesearchaeota archaeon]
MTQTVEAMVEGGKATAAPPLGPALGPLGINIGQVISEINKKTADFKGMQVPIKIVVADDKSFTVSVGTPPASALIKKEAGVEKGSGNPLADKIADIRIEQVIKIAKMKNDDLLGKNLFSKVKEIMGTCDSMGVLVEGLQARDAIAKVNAGEWKQKILSGKTELSAEELKKLEEEKKLLQAELEKRKAQFLITAKQVVESMVGKPRGQIKARLLELKVPMSIIEEVLPAEAAAATVPGATGGKAPAAGASAKPAAKK